MSKIPHPHGNYFSKNNTEKLLQTANYEAVRVLIISQNHIYAINYHCWKH